MSIADPIANMATLIRNASTSGKEKVDIKASNMNEEILRLLKGEKFIDTYKKIEDSKQGMLRVYLKFNEDRTPAISSIKRVSKPGLRVYKRKDEIVPVLGGLGINIISTSQGLVTDKEAREKAIGGEVLLEVW
jgi:small subunit ribosomal protein S8